MAGIILLERHWLTIWRTKAEAVVALLRDWGGKKTIPSKSLSSGWRRGERLRALTLPAVVHVIVYQPYSHCTVQIATTFARECARTDAVTGIRGVPGYGPTEISIIISDRGPRVFFSVFLVLHVYICVCVRVLTYRGPQQGAGAVRDRIPQEPQPLNRYLQLVGRDGRRF